MKNKSFTRMLGIFAMAAITITPAFGQQGQGQRQGTKQGHGQGQGQRSQQGRMMTEEQVTERTKKTATMLECSEEQTKKMLDFELATYKENQSKRQELTGDREAIRAYMKKQRTVREAKYKEILTEEQYKKYKEYQEERMQQRQQRPQQQAPESRPPRGRGR